VQLDVGEVAEDGVEDAGLVQPGDGGVVWYSSSTSAAPGEKAAMYWRNCAATFLSSDNIVFIVNGLVL
jgi:hypothetical protein